MTYRAVMALADSERTGPAVGSRSLDLGLLRYLEEHADTLMPSVRSGRAFGFRMIRCTLPGRTYCPMYQCASISAP